MCLFGILVFGGVVFHSAGGKNQGVGEAILPELEFRASIGGFYGRWSKDRREMLKNVRWAFQR